MSAIRIALLLVVVVAPTLSGCQGCNTRGLRRFGSTCGSDKECSGGVCFKGRCTKSCKADGDCAGGICIEQICQTPDDDFDGDGLTNGAELALGTKPNDKDSDGDGVPDKAEVGSIKSPKDANGDGKIDALQSNKEDADGDCMVDAIDTAPADASQSGLPTAAKLCDTGVCATDLSKVAVVCAKDAPTYDGVVLGCVGCQCKAEGVSTWQADETLCDSLDNDCDGLTDEGLEFDGKAIGKPCAGIYGICALIGTDGSVPTGVVECGTDQKVTCSVHGNGSQSVATTESCNYLDDDCDNATDEGYTWTPPDGSGPLGIGSACDVCGATQHVCPGGAPADAPRVACAGDGGSAVCSGLPYAKGFVEHAAGRPQPRLHWSAAYLASADELVVYGGAVPTPQGSTATDDLWILPLAGSQPKRWKRVRHSPPGLVAGAALIADPSGDRLLLVGGRLNGQLDGTIWALDSKHVWTKLTLALPATAHSGALHGAVVGAGANRRLVVFSSGKGAWQTPLVGSPSWSQLPMPSAPAGYAPVDGAPACVVPVPGSSAPALVVGAAKVGASASVVRLHLDGGKVSATAIGASGAAPNRFAPGCALLSDGSLHVFGGHEPTGPSKPGARVATFGGDPQTATVLTWADQATAPLAKLARSGAWATHVASRNETLIIGGYARTGGSPWRRESAYAPLVLSQSATVAVALDAPVPRPRVGAAGGVAPAGDLCIAGGLGFDLPDEGGSDARVVPLQDAWCADGSGVWTQLASALPPIAFSANGVDPADGRLIMAGGLDLTPGEAVPEAWRIWRAALVYHKDQTTVARPKVTDKVRILDLKTGKLTEHPVAGPEFAMASAVIDRVGRRLIAYGGVDDAKPLDKLWLLDLETMAWTDMSKTYPDGIDRPLPGYGQIITYLPTVDTLLLGGGVSYDQAIDKGTGRKDEGTWQVTYQTINGAQQALAGNPCYGPDKTVLWGVATKSAAFFKPIPVPTWADLEPGKAPTQPLMQLHFGQPLGVPVLFDTAGSAGFVAMQRAPRFASVDGDGKACPGLPKARFTDTSVHVRLTVGMCSDKATFFLEPQELDPVPPAMAWAVGDYDDDGRRSWVFGALDAEGRLDAGLWSVTQTCGGSAP